MLFLDLFLDSLSKVQADLQLLTILLPKPLECQGYRYEPPCQALITFNSNVPRFCITYFQLNNLFSTQYKEYTCHSLLKNQVKWLTF